MNRNVTALILIVLAVGVYFTYTSGQISTLKSIQAVNAQYQTALDNANRLIKLRDAALAQYNGISDTDKSRLDVMVPSTVDNIRLILDISGIAQMHGLTAGNITTSADSQGQSGQSAAAAGPSGLNVVTVSFTVNTSYQNFISFLEDLERSLRILDVTQITLTPSDTGAYTYGVTLDTYWLNQ
jgi:Tfp pilus assembly protein PilO